MAKMTKKENLAKIVTFLTEHNADSEMIEVINNEIGILERKSTSRKPTKTQLENETVVRPAICNFLSDENGKRFSAKEIGSALGYTPQKITPQLTILVEQGLVHKETEKKVNMYWV